MAYFCHWQIQCDLNIAQGTPNVLFTVCWESLFFCLFYSLSLSPFLSSPLSVWVCLLTRIIMGNYGLNDKVCHAEFIQGCYFSSQRLMCVREGWGEGTLKDWGRKSSTFGEQASFISSSQDLWSKNPGVDFGGRWSHLKALTDLGT